MYGRPNTFYTKTARLVCTAILKLEYHQYLVTPTNLYLVCVFFFLVCVYFSVKAK